MKIGELPRTEHQTNAHIVAVNQQRQQQQASSDKNNSDMPYHTTTHTLKIFSNILHKQFQTNQPKQTKICQNVSYMQHYI